MSSVYIIDGLRTAVVPRHGAFKHLSVQDLAAPVIRQILDRTQVATDAVDAVYVGNALYGGGNPARVLALAAGLPESMPAFSIDTQCCSGMDAATLAARQIQAGAADVVLAGGVESYSRSAIRQHRPLKPSDQPEVYERPPFTPWPERDPEMVVAAARVAVEQNISRQQQHEWVMQSHAKALSAKQQLVTECAPLSAIDFDPAGRSITAKLCQRSALLAGEGEFAVDVASTALQADAAAFVLLVSERWLAKHGDSFSTAIKPVCWLGAATVGGAADQPPLALPAACRAVLNVNQQAISDITVAEIMEAFAVQAISNTQELGLSDHLVNRSGGALARGHPIGASGAVLLVRLLHEMQQQSSGDLGLAAIAAAGGIASATLLQA